MDPLSKILNTCVSFILSKNIPETMDLTVFPLNTNENKYILQNKSAHLGVTLRVHYYWWYWRGRVLGRALKSILYHSSSANYLVHMLLLEHISN